MIKSSTTGWRRIWNATGYSINGIKAAWRNEAAFRQELAVVLVMLPAAWWVGTTMTQRALLVFSLLMVLIVELLNSAVEAAVDRIGVEWHELSGRAKNLGSAAVMVSLIAAAAVWGFAVWEKWH
jgi:diacylglycerol kinase (ATP)